MDAVAIPPHHTDATTAPGHLVDDALALQRSIDPRGFYQAVHRPDLAHIMTPETPFAYWSMELYDQSHGIRGGGGLGVLAADTRRVAEELGIPFVVITPFYRRETHQSLDAFWQQEWHETVTPEQHGFCYVATVQLSTKGNPDTSLAIYKKQLGSTTIITITEPNFGELYQGENNSDHRLYQEVSLGFGGFAALRHEGIRPAAMQLNEAPTVFAIVAELDELCGSGVALDDAITQVRARTLYTNHTLVQAVEGTFTADQFERFVLPNVHSPAVRDWLMAQCAAQQVRLSTLAIELSGARNGVSAFHAEVANFTDSHGNRVPFTAVTNGIDLKTWVLPELLDYYREQGIIDRFDMPTAYYGGLLNTLEQDVLRQLKAVGRQVMNDIFAERADQYGQPIFIPHDAVLYDFRRRFAAYKRPAMLFEDSAILSQILEAQNAHVVLSGKPHPNDVSMKHELQRILQLIDAHPVLKERVHYVQDYDEEVSWALAVGGDVAINVPVIGQEACGTSWEKDIANAKLLISTADGGVADVRPPACIEVTGTSYETEVASLYACMRQAGELLEHTEAWRDAVVRSLGGYLPVLSGSRMLRDYLHFTFPSEQE